MRRISIVTLVVVALAGGSGIAKGPSGSSEGKKGTKQYNNIKCGKGQNVGGFKVYAGTNGVEACNAGGAKNVPQGRVIVTNQQGGYVAADGDRNNKQNAYLQGYMRIDGKGAHCGKPKGVQDSTGSQPKKNTCP